jgi:hypothetical protein
MRVVPSPFWLPVGLLLLAVPASAQGMTLSGNPPPLVVSTATAGFPPDPVADTNTTYDLVVLGTSKIVGRLKSPLPAGVVLRVTLTAPAGGVSSGAVVLSDTDQDLVRLIPLGSYSGLAIRYELVAAVSVSPVLSTLDVTFTVAADS